MNNWLNELKKLGAKDSILKYYKDLIIEQDLTTYDQICSEIGTPQSVYAEEYGENTIKEIKENLSTKIFKNARNIFLSIFVIFPLSMLIFALFSSLVAFLGGFIAVWFVNTSILQKLVLSFLVICLFISTITLIHILFRVFLKVSRIISNITQKVSFNKKILLLGLITFITSSVLIIFLPNDYKKIEISQGPRNSQTLNITDKNLDISLDDSDVEIVQDSKNSIEYSGYGKISANNGKIRVDDKKSKILFGFAFALDFEEKEKIKLHVTKDTKLSFSGSDNSINLNNTQLQKFKTNSVDAKIKLNNLKSNELEIFGMDTNVSLNDSNVNIVQLNSSDSTFNYKNSKVINLENNDNSTIVNKK